MYHYSISEERARNICGAFLFREDDVFKKIKNLSGGEKTRLAFMKLMLEQPNFLILDEPTNHLDIYSREILINALENYDGTILTVSHDRSFLDSVVNKIYELTTEGVKTFDGDYEAYSKEKEKIKLKNEEAAQRHEMQKKNRNRISILEKKYLSIEDEIKKLEEKKELKNKDYEQAGKENNMEVLMDLNSQIQNLDEKILEKLEEWEAIEQELIELKGE